MVLTEPKTGELNRRVAIKRWQDMPATSGSITVSDTLVATVWAKIEPVGNAIFFGTKQVGEDVTDRIYIRRTSALTERTITGEHVCESGGLRYRVRRASALNGEKKFVLLDVECLGDA